MFQNVSATGQGVPPSQVMLIPETKPEVDLIMVATGTGIAPYRSFIRRLFVEETPFGTPVEGASGGGASGDGGLAARHLALAHRRQRPTASGQPGRFLARRG